MSRSILPIPDAKHVGLTTYDAKDPDTRFPPIEPLLPPSGAPNVLIILLDDIGFGASSGKARGGAAGAGLVGAALSATTAAGGVVDDGAGAGGAGVGATGAAVAGLAVALVMSISLGSGRG